MIASLVSYFDILVALKANQGRSSVKCFVSIRLFTSNFNKAENNFEDLVDIVIADMTLAKRIFDEKEEYLMKELSDRT